MLRPYTGQYVSVKVPTSTIDSLRFYESCIEIEVGEDNICHLRVERMYEAGPSFRELSSCQVSHGLQLQPLWITPYG